MNARTAAQKTKVITQQELVDKIRFIDGAQEIEVEFVAVTDPRMRKTSKYDRSVRNPYLGAMKMTRNKAYINGRYIDRVNEQLVKEGKKPHFQAQQLPWGDKEVSNGCIINHTNGPKLQLIGVENLERDFIFENDFISPEQLEPFMPEKKPAKSQGTDEEVVVRTFNVSSIKKLRIGATMYIVRG